jgi:hypothetical protein
VVAKVRALPEPRQLALLESLSEELAGEPYVLSDEERAIIKPALEEATRAENLIDLENLNLCNRGPRLDGRAERDLQDIIDHQGGRQPTEERRNTVPKQIGIQTHKSRKLCQKLSLA